MCVVTVVVIDAPKKTDVFFFGMRIAREFLNQLHGRRKGEFYLLLFCLSVCLSVCLYVFLRQSVSQSVSQKQGGEGERERNDYTT
jgi:hypothetical protein